MPYYIVGHKYWWQPGNAPLVGPDNRQFVDREVAALAGLYVPPAEVDHAVAIAKCESGFWTGAWRLDGEDSRGLWQINVAAGAHPELAGEYLFDPQVCAYWMGTIFAKSGWSPWSCAKQLGIVK